MVVNCRFEYVFVQTSTLMISDISNYYCYWQMGTADVDHLMRNVLTVSACINLNSDRQCSKKIWYFTLIMSETP